MNTLNILGRTPLDHGCAPASTDVLVLRITRGDHEIVTRRLYGGDATPEEEWSGRTVAVRLTAADDAPCVVDQDRLNADLEAGGFLRTRIARVQAGLSVGTDRRGILDDDARAALDDIEDAAAEQRWVDPRFEVWDAKAWIGDAIEWLDDLGSPAEIVQEAIDQGVILLGGEAAVEAASAAARDARS